MPSCRAARAGDRPASTNASAELSFSSSSGPAPHRRCCLKSVTGTFTDKPALKVRDCAENVEDQFPCRRTRINALLKRNEGYASLFQFLDSFKQFPE